MGISTSETNIIVFRGIEHRRARNALENKLLEHVRN
jgi:hypothetical protein